MLEHLKVSDYGTPRRESAEEVTLQIDGVDVTVAKGTSIMRAAMDMGVKVPKLLPCLMHDTRRARHEGAHSNAQAAGAAQGCDGAVHQ